MVGHYTNTGFVQKTGAGTFTLKGDYTTSGVTELKAGTFFIDGYANQIGGNPTGAWFKLFAGSTVALGGTGLVLDIRAGAIVGGGTVQGNLTIGDPASTAQSGTAIISPGVDDQHSGGQVIGTLTITGNFQMFDGEMHIEYDKVTTTNDKVVVNNGYVKLGPNQAPNPPETFPGGKLVGSLIGPWAWPDPFAINTEYPFMTYVTRHNDFTAQGPNPPGWHAGVTENVNPKNYWFKKSGGGGSGGGGSGGSSPLMAELTWDDQETSDLRQDKAAVKLFDASGNFLAASADDWAGPAAFGGLGEGSYRVDYVKPSPARSMASKPVRHDPGAAPPWIQMPRTDDDDQSYDIDAELSIS